ncbi:MAG: transcription-repair coupling factor [Deltaproteobacteria bacterium RIFCSPLOWO2_02_44_9]|nr:MAG: transcription-repair coupling factor [Deltaproteobacteria bacterium RIFCSPLOWO2_02_44_9]
MSYLKSGERCVLSGLLGSSKAFFIASLLRTPNSELRTILIVSPTQEEAETLAKDINFFLREEVTLFYPPCEVLPFEPQSPHPDISASRTDILYNIAQNLPHIIVTTPSAIMQRVIPMNVLMSAVLRLGVGSEADRDEFLKKLLDMGYSKTTVVEDRGEMRVSGGIMDIFSPSCQSPVRIEFFGDKIESIRTFDSATQRSLKEMKEVVILPASEDGYRSELKSQPEHHNQQITATFFDYLPEDCIVFIDNPDEVEAAASEFEEEIIERKIRLEQKGGSSIRPEEVYMPLGEFKSAIYRNRVVAIGSSAQPSSKEGLFEILTESNLDIRQDISIRKEELLKPLADRIKGWQDLGWSIFIVCHTAGQAERLKDLLEGYGLRCEMWDMGCGKSLFYPLPPTSHPLIIIGDLSSGFRFPSVNLAVVTEEEIFGQRIKRRVPPSSKIDVFLTQLQDLNVGDFVVHTVHGVGLYKGLKRLKIEDSENDFLLLEYQDGDRLYLPVQRLNLVGKYHGTEGRIPLLDKLGSTNWEKRKSKVKKAVEEMAKELLELYASRKVIEGFSFSKGDRLFSEFEASFEYEETPDQARAIEEVLSDMEETRAMDRLVCGDVGYGKTEVAMRAAFKAVLDNKQVAVLVPTTVLAQQHYITFQNRFAAYPVTVEVLSRFRSHKEQKEILKKIASREVDIIIGTHRLLQKDIAFKDLGIIVIDEEHRFGVSHKERLKQMRKHVDVLTLTATPIPRTLHMSISGIRDLSIINTPPEDRLAIKTIVAMFDDDLIRDAIMRELVRGGQIFFVHNRVQSIGAMADYLRRLVPEARIGVAHGQMKEKELEMVMAAFVNKEYDILLSTSIIESGLDIPSANTILINRADRFGLAEIYQLRGRVGRSRHRAYAYLLTPPEITLTGDAKKRLKVLQELSDLGAGFRLATYDLEIRGAGELLGKAQSGQIAEVGFEMYIRLLEEAIKELKGEKMEREIEPEINLNVSAYIPEEYIPDERQRLNIYKRIASVSSETDITGLKEEIKDRFGGIPVSVDNLFRIMGIKLLLKQTKITELNQKGSFIYMAFSNDTSVEPQKLLRLMNRNPKKFRLTPDSRFIASLEKGKEVWGEIRYVLQQLVQG